VCWHVTGYWGTDEPTFYAGDDFDQGGTHNVAPGLGDVAKLSVGEHHACALTQSHQLYCWGVNDRGQVGTGHLTYSATPSKVAGINDATTVAAGGNNTCALRVDHTVACWGANFNGQVGDGTWFDRPTPRTVAGLTDAVAVATGEDHSCAIRSNGTAACWGNNDYGQIGNGGQTWEFDGFPWGQNTPGTVLGLTNVAAISPGEDTTCAVEINGTTWCWGGGYIGNGAAPTHDNNPIAAPVQVLGITDAVSVATGSDHTCVLHSGGTVSCWGANNDYQLGDGTLQGPRLSPQPVPGLDQVAAITSHGSRTCATKTTGEVWCWGAPFNHPVHLGGALNGTAASSGPSHLCAVQSDGTVYCQGLDGFGQIGDGTTGDSGGGSASGLTTAVSVAAGSNHSCAVTADHGVDCWGDNSAWQLGNDVRDTVPQQVTA
jgi:alpha-tubulin suppressor-like RCC1 family protein